MPRRVSCDTRPVHLKERRPGATDGEEQLGIAVATGGQLIDLRAAARSRTLRRVHACLGHGARPGRAPALGAIIAGCVVAGISYYPVSGLLASTLALRTVICIRQFTGLNPGRGLGDPRVWATPRDPGPPGRGPGATRGPGRPRASGPRASVRSRLAGHFVY